MKISEVVSAIEAYAPPALQEEYDNTGYQVGTPSAEATGALLCVDVTEDIVAEAKARGINLIISHHPLLFRGVKQVMWRNRPERVLAQAIRDGLTIYSSHTAMDSAPGGVSWRMAAKLGLRDVCTLVPSGGGSDAGLGVVGDLPCSVCAHDFAEMVKRAFGCTVLRTSRLAALDAQISRAALCGGAAAEFVPEAVAAGAQVYVTADCKLNQFLDHASDIWLVDAGHFETEECTKEIFFDILTKKFPNFAVCYSDTEKNPIIYL